MPKVYVYKDEWYPVYGFTDNSLYAIELEFTADELERIECAEIELRSCQNLIRDRWDTTDKVRTSTIEFTTKEDK